MIFTIRSSFLTRWGSSKQAVPKVLYSVYNVFYSRTKHICTTRDTIHYYLISQYPSIIILDRDVIILKIVLSMMFHGASLGGGIRYDSADHSKDIQTTLHAFCHVFSFYCKYINSPYAGLLRSIFGMPKFETEYGVRKSAQSWIGITCSAFAHSYIWYSLLLGKIKSSRIYYIGRDWRNWTKQAIISVWFGMNPLAGPC